MTARRGECLLTNGMAKTKVQTRHGTKLSSEERREAIIHAVRRVFAERGFDGTTTRELAEAAEVSEALLFKHFPTKEALFSAMKLSCFATKAPSEFERLTSLEPSTSTLIVMVYFMTTRMLDVSSSGDEDSIIQNRLMLRSFAEDGDFAQSVLGGLKEHWIPQVEKCLKVAVKAGDAHLSPLRASSAGWFAQHLAAMIMIHLLPTTPVVNYELSTEKLVEQIVWFSLRGMGFKDDAIKRYYNAKALTLLED